MSMPASTADPAEETVPVFSEPDAALDAEVETCLATPGVNFLPGSDVICYNAAIFPEEFLQLADMAPVSRIIISSPGGNVATARMMSRILDTRDEPVVIAGQCMSACAMVIVPGADELLIHRSAHIAVHGIAMMGFDDWFGWLKAGAEPSSTDRMVAGLGYNFPYALHKSGRDHMSGHLEGQHVDPGYITDISERMQRDALEHPCRVGPDQYWGMIDAAHLRTYLGDRIVHMERFNQVWDEPENTLYRDTTVPISPTTYIFRRDYEGAGCAD